MKFIDNLKERKNRKEGTVPIKKFEETADADETAAISESDSWTPSCGEGGCADVISLCLTLDYSLSQKNGQKYKKQQEALIRFLEDLLIRGFQVFVFVQLIHKSKVVCYQLDFAPLSKKYIVSLNDFLSTLEPEGTSPIAEAVYAGSKACAAFVKKKRELQKNKKMTIGEVKIYPAFNVIWTDGLSTEKDAKKALMEQAMYFETSENMVINVFGRTEEPNERNGFMETSAFRWTSKVHHVIPADGADLTKFFKTFTNTIAISLGNKNKNSVSHSDEELFEETDSGFELVFLLNNYCGGVHYEG